MKILKLLKKHRSDVSEKWYKLVISKYPPETTQFMEREKDRFANPVGSTTKKSLEDVLDELLSGGFDHEKMKSALDPLIRILAVQEFKPSKALSYIFGLKSIIRVVLKKEMKQDASLSEELSDLDLKIDEMSLIAYDIYTGCRDQIYQFKANHVKDRTLRLLKKANILCEVPEMGTEIIPYNVYKNGGFDDK